MARSMGKIVEHRDFLKTRMDPDKVLDWLLAKTILSNEDVDEVKCLSTISRRNDKLLDYVVEINDEEEFINALRDTDQKHLANYLLNDGVRSHNLLEDWPLEETQVKIIDVNRGSLKDMIDMGGGLVDNLLARRVINERQRELICSKALNLDKTDTFLDILRRRSIGDYANALQCLRESNQDHIAVVLEKGGAVLPVHAELQEPSEEVRLAERITDMLRGLTTEESDRILEMARDKIIAVKIGRSIIFYFYLKTHKSWQEMKNTIQTGVLKHNIEELCRRADSHTNVVIKGISIQDDDIQIVDSYFSSEATGLNIYSRMCVLGSNRFVRFFIISVLLYISIVTIAFLYAALTIPCATKHLECEMAKQKIDVIQQMHGEFSLRFKQLQKANSELLQTVKESPDEDDLIRLVLEMFDSANEETRMKIRERILELGKKLVEKKVLLATEEQAEEVDDEDGIIRVPITFTFTFTQTVFVRRYLELPEPPETDVHEVYENALKEKLRAVEYSMNETLLVLVRLIDETEELNCLLITILEKFQEKPEDACREMRHIKDSETRSYPELGRGMSRLVCLLDETVRMTALLRDLNTQATSLKDDVDRMVEQVNEFTKQSIPSLLATLLTVQPVMSNKMMKPH